MKTVVIKRKQCLNICFEKGSKLQVATPAGQRDVRVVAKYKHMGGVLAAAGQ